MGNVKGGGNTSVSAADGGGWTLLGIAPVVSGAEWATVAGTLRRVLRLPGSAFAAPKAASVNRTEVASVAQDRHLDQRKFASGKGM